MPTRKPALAGVLALALALPALGEEPETKAGGAPETGQVTGAVINMATGDFLPRAVVRVLPDGPEIMTDLDGLFNLELPNGHYDLEVSAEGFLVQKITGVSVNGQGVTFQDVALNPRGMDLGSVTVVAEASRASEAALLAERKSAATVVDSVSRQEIARSTGSDAADVMQRVTGVSIVEDKYVYVRGLGERYSNTVLNNSVLPSTQPDKKVVAIDLFPNALLQNIRIEKSYAPDQPGEFSGGLVKVETVDFPRVPTLKVSFSEGFGTNTFGKDFLDYPGGGRDWLGFDDGTRALPSIIPGQRVVRQTRFTTFGFTPEEMETLGESFANVWEPRTESATLPNQSFSVVGGNTYGKLGVVFSFSHTNKWESRQEINNIFVVGEGGEGVRSFHEYEFDVSRRSIRTGIVANVAYELTQDHRFQLRNFYVHDTTDEARFFEGFNGDAENEVQDFRLRFIEEGLLSSQASGEHYLKLFGNGLIEWRLTFANSQLDEPDLRETLYEFNDAIDEFVLADESQSGLRMFNFLNEDLWEPALDWTVFFIKNKMTGSVKFGGSYRTRDRGFSSRRFRFIPLNTREIDISLPPEQIFVPENIGSDGFEIREETRPTDTYTARQITRAVYGMADLAFGKWRLIGGLRVEGDTQAVDTFDVFDREGPARVTTRIARTDVLPSASVIYRLSPAMNLRGGYSKTLNRPEFRELAPFDFTDVVGGRSVVGNPDLERALIRNYDVRWEWFPGGEELISASFFYKDFDSPIERVVRATAQISTTFQNAKGARNLGLELEVRKNLGGFSSRLEPFKVLANYTFVDSEIELVPEAGLINTTFQRPLTGQSRHVLNTVFEYHRPASETLARVLFNYQGSRITDVGTFGIPEIIQEGFPKLDFALFQKLGQSRWSLKFTAENLLNNEHEFTNGGEPFRVFKTGRMFSIGLSYSFFDN